MEFANNFHFFVVLRHKNSKKCCKHLIFRRLDKFIPASHCQRLPFGVIYSGKDLFVWAVGIELQNPLPSTIHISSRYSNKSKYKPLKSAGG